MPEAGKHDKSREQADGELPATGTGGAGGSEHDEVTSVNGSRSEDADSGHRRDECDLAGAAGITDKSFNKTFQAMRAAADDAGVSRLFGSNQDLLPSSASFDSAAQKQRLSTASPATANAEGATDKVHTVAPRAGGPGDAPSSSSSSSSSAPKPKDLAADSRTSSAGASADGGSTSGKPGPKTASETVEPSAPAKPTAAAAASRPTSARSSGDAANASAKPEPKGSAETVEGSVPAKTTDAASGPSPGDRTGGGTGARVGLRTAEIAADRTDKPAEKPESARLPELEMNNDFNADILARMQRAAGRVMAPEALRDLQQRMDALAKTDLFQEDLRPAARKAQNLAYTEQYARTHPLVAHEDRVNREARWLGTKPASHSADYWHYKAAEAKAKQQRMELESRIDKICERRTAALQKTFNKWLTDYGEKPQTIRLDTRTPMDYKSRYQPQASHVGPGKIEVSRPLLLAAGERAPLIATMLVHEGVAHEKQVSDALRGVLKVLPDSATNDEVRRFYNVRTSYKGPHLSDADIADAKELNVTRPWTADDEKRANEFLDGIENYRSSFGGSGEEAVHSLHSVRENLAALRDDPKAAATDIFERMCAQHAGGKYSYMFRGEPRAGSLRKPERYGNELAARLLGAMTDGVSPQARTVLAEYDKYILAHFDEETGAPRQHPKPWDAAQSGKVLLGALEKTEAELSHEVEDFHKPYSENTLEKWAYQSEHLLALANDPKKLFQEQPRAVLEVADFVNQDGRISPAVGDAMRQSMPAFQEFVRQHPEKAVESLARVGNSTSSTGAELLRRSGAMEVVFPLLNRLPPETAARLLPTAGAGGTRTADAPSIVRDRRRTAGRLQGAESSDGMVAHGQGDIRTSSGGGYEVTNAGTGSRTTTQGAKAADLKTEDLAHLEKEIMDNERTTAAEKARALEALKLARNPANREAREAVLRAQREGKRSGVEGAEGHAVGIALVALTLAGWYASYKLNRVQEDSIPGAKVN